MFLLNSLRKKESDLYNDKSQDFIPVACHYDPYTLLTKNGELIQILQINGINSEKISDKLFNLRQTVREAVKNNIKGDNFAIWIHTVRRKTDLDDVLKSEQELPSYIHELWCKKNYWRDKFVNTLYISIVHDSANLEINNFNSFTNSLFSDVAIDFHNKYFDSIFTKLNFTVNNILKDLEEYGAVKLGFRFEGDKCFSDTMFLYRKILHLNEDSYELTISDLSESLASHKYAVGGDKIEVIDEFGKKFTSIISIKEYGEVSPTYLDNFLQLPVEFIATEIFYLVNNKDISDIFKEQAYLLKVSNDEEMLDIKGINQIIKNNPDSKFCYQQMSIAIMGEDLKKLDSYIAKASDALSEIGIVHVREDINLEQTFWSQLPGNFSFIRRRSITDLKDIAALASLHNFPTGLQYSPWGKQITLLRTEKGTPYFMNFHSDDSKNTTCIFGTTGSGKTILTNFLISESMKFKPSILYLSNNETSKLFINSIGGEWKDDPYSIINPFLCENSDNGKLFLKEFLKIICNHYIKPLDEENLLFLDDLIKKIFKMKLPDRNLSMIIEKNDFSGKGGKLIESELKILIENGFYKGIFDSEVEFIISEESILGLNLNKLSTGYFYKKFVPDEKKLIAKFEKDCLKNDSIRAGLIYALSYYFYSTSSEIKKIYVMDNMESICGINHFYGLMEYIFAQITNNNGVILNNFNVDPSLEMSEEIYLPWSDLNSASIILPSEAKINNLTNLMKLTKYEKEKLYNLSPLSRMFLLKNSQQSIIAELSIGSLVEVVRILSARKDEFDIYNQLIAEDAPNVTSLLLGRLKE